MTSYLGNKVRNICSKTLRGKYIFPCIFTLCFENCFDSVRPLNKIFAVLWIDVCPCISKDYFSVCVDYKCSLITMFLKIYHIFSIEFISRLHACHIIIFCEKEHVSLSGTTAQSILIHNYKMCSNCASKLEIRKYSKIQQSIFPIPISIHDI